MDENGDIMRKFLIALFIVVFILGFAFMCDLAQSADLDSTRHVRVKVYSLLGVDTTGSNNLPTSQVDDYVNYSIGQTNNDLQCYRRVSLIVSTSGARYTALDSVVYINSCQLVTNDSIIGLHVIRSQEIVDSVVAIENNTEDVDDGKYPEYVFKWSDSVGFVPTPVQTDTFQVLYTHVIPEDSMRLIPLNDRLGVLYYAVFLAATDISDPKAEFFLQRYESFIAKRAGLK